MAYQKNIMQIDVEDWYCDIDIQKWGDYTARVTLGTNKILSLLRKTNNSATFFILGYVAENFPELVEKIQEEGHEIASHGYAHKKITEQTRKEFEDDLSKSLEILEKITSRKVIGYRAPCFTVVKETMWAIDILKKKGLKYDSSIFPVRTPMYGIPDSPLYPYVLHNSLIEIPLSIYKIPLIRKNIPIAGGFYLRFFPYFFIKHAIKKINKAKKVAVCYIHPWELDPGKPKIKDLRWYHYYRIKPTEKKLKKLLMDFKFTSTAEWLKNNKV